MTACWLEGPVCTLEQEVYFTDVRGNRILRMDAAGRLSTFRGPEYANYPNGQALDRSGCLLTCEAGDPATGAPPRVTRTDLRTGAVEVVIDSFEGSQLSGPSDIVVDRQGCIFFTDAVRPFFLPPLTGTAGSSSRRSLESTSVFRISPCGAVSRLLGDGAVLSPNGIGLSPDDRTLYVVENDIRANAVRQLRAFDVSHDGVASNMRVVRDFSPGRSADGLTVDCDGNLYVAAGLNHLRGTDETLDTVAGIHVLSVDGALRRIIRIWEDSVTNVTFGGPDLRTLYITAGKSVFTFRNDSAGARR
nr:SMP-30/gluconolactonase/LRE family protein [Burkholderia cenocepacia]